MWVGGLGIGNPRLLSDSQFDSSVKITTALVAQIVKQDSLFSMATVQVEVQHPGKSEVYVLIVKFKLI